MEERLTKKKYNVTSVPRRESVIWSNEPYSVESYFDPTSHFSRSINGEQIGARALRKISRNILFSRAIERISNGVVSMPWTIIPPNPEGEDDEQKKKEKEKAKTLTKALKRPNREEHSLYTNFAKALIRDLLVLGVAIVERQEGAENYQPFWLWATPPEHIMLDPDWDPSQEGRLPRFWYCQNQNLQSYKDSINDKDWIPILNKNMFLIQHRAASDELFPPSPVRLAYEDVTTWLNLHRYQARTVSNPVRDYLIAIEDESPDSVEAFREYWRVNVVGSGEIPVIGGKVDVVKFGARNDEELFMKFSDYLAGLIALEFGLSKRDYGIDPHDNRSTMGPAADLSFQDAILPLASCLTENLSVNVIDFYAEGYSLELTDTEPRKESEEAQTAKTLYEGELITKNEARRRIGEKPLVEGGDKFHQGPPSPDAQASAQPNPLQASATEKKRRTKRNSLTQSQLEGVQLKLF